MNEKIFSHFFAEKNYLSHKNIVQQPFFTQIFFPEGTQPCSKITEIPGGWGGGGGGMTSTPWVGGLKQKCPSWGGGVLIFSGTTHFL